MPLVFAYGTLRRGGGNNPLLAPATFVRAAKTRDEFVLFCENPDFCPYLTDVSIGQKKQIIGDVYDVPDYLLEQIDELEGHPTWYRRRQVALEGGDGDGDQVAWAYFITDTCLEQMRRWPLLIIPSGDWFNQEGLVAAS